MVELTDRQLDAAEAAGGRVIESEPRAVSVKYDAKARRVAIELADGRAYAFPVGLVQDLHGVADSDLKHVEIDGLGLNLHWPALDVDLYVPALIAGVFGTKAWMTSALARLAGQSTSPAKAAASRANGAKGGRPRKTA